MEETSRDMNDRPAPPPVSARRRALLKAGWVTPMIVTVSLPVSGFAANASGNVGADPQEEIALTGELGVADTDSLIMNDDPPPSQAAGAGNIDDPGGMDSEPGTGATESDDGENVIARGRGRRLKRGVRPKIHARDKGQDER